eukprot:TRINITY_DN21504_c0_g1_i1.p2 TRINITY_DN21504_c0_g1~~TRINITY_DN21504_c0_g1_i1.p2  ORF type:complete len:148 (+),score=11.42 TRINITY_DN21504_c0_g1_i1:78-521(+)
MGASSDNQRPHAHRVAEDRERYLSEAKEVHGIWSTVRRPTGRSLNPIFERTSYAKQAELCAVTPFTHVNVFPRYHNIEARMHAGNSGRNVLHGRAPPPAPKSPAATTTTRSPAAVTPEQIRDRHIVRALEAGHVQRASQLPLPTLFT